MLSSIRGLVFALSLVTTAIVGTVHIIFVAFISLFPLSRRAYRAVVDFVQWTWLANAAGLIELLAGVRIHADVDDLAAPHAGDRVVLIVMNHHCRLDWMFFWAVAARLRRCGTLKIALKDPMRKIPWFGWAMQAFLFIFLRRNDREGDLSRLRARLSHMVAHGDDVALLIFPEGTDLSPANQAKDAEFVAKKGGALAPYAHLLHPRTAGFVEALKALVAAGRLDAIYDVTVRYDNHPAVAASADPRPNELHLLKGHFPRAVHVEMARHTPWEEMKTDEGAAAWLMRLWDAKERRLAAREPSAAGEGRALPLWLLASYLCFATWWLAATTAVGWALVGAGGSWAWAWAVRLCTLVGTVALGIATAKGGGLDLAELAFHPAPKIPSRAD